MIGASTTSMAKQSLHPHAFAAWRLLKYTYGIVAIAAGLDKFFNVLTKWSLYINPSIPNMISLQPVHFMYIVGVVEIAAGLLVLSKYTKFGAYVVALWLFAIAANIVTLGIYYDIAVRDAVIGVGAIALGLLSCDVKLVEK
jgi:hypothetical protein